MGKWYILMFCMFGIFCFNFGEFILDMLKVEIIVFVLEMLLGIWKELL